MEYILHCFPQDSSKWLKCLIPCKSTNCEVYLTMKWVWTPRLKVSLSGLEIIALLPPSSQSSTDRFWCHLILDTFLSATFLNFIFVPNKGKYYDNVSWWESSIFHLAENSVGLSVLGNILEYLLVMCFYKIPLFYCSETTIILMLDHQNCNFTVFCFLVYPSFFLFVLFFF